MLAQDPEEREIEYMPPREAPKEENYDDIWPRDRDYSMFQGSNMTRGWLSEYLPEKEDNVDDDELSDDFEEKYKKAVEREKKEAAAKKRPLTSKGTNTALKATPPTMRAQHAASALSSRSSKPAAANTSTSTTSAKTRQPTGTSASRKPMFDKGNPRFTAAKAASNSTIGYSKGRVVSAHRRPLSDVHSQPPKQEPEEKVTLDELLNLDSMEIADEDADLGSGLTNQGLDQLTEDEPEVFQLDPPEEI